jgi:TolB-like protein
LEEAVSPGIVVSYDALSGTIIKLRRALGDDSRNPTYLETISKKGYRLLAPVSTIGSGTQGAGSPESPLRRMPFWSKTHTAIVVVGLLIALGLVLVSVSTDRDQALVSPTGTADKTSIAVLPFHNLNQDPAQEYFSDGITDDLINDLSGYSNLHVVARRSAYIYKRRDLDIQTIARELGVKYVVDGSLRRNEGMLRLNVQLIDAADGTNLWSQRFDQQVSDIFAVQDHIRKQIIDKLSIALTNEERARTRRRYTDSFEAYDLFLQGQARLVTRASAEDSQAAQALMEQAITLDPGFARAHAALALIYADAWRFDWSDDPERTRKLALQIGTRAVELDPQSPQAYWILGYIDLFCFEQHEKALEAARRSLELLPDNPDGLTVMAVTLAFGDDPQRARLLMQELMQRNKRYSALVPSVLGLANFRLGSFSEALAAYDESLLINPSRAQGNAYRALTLYRMGNLDEAEFQVDVLYSLHPSFDVRKWAARQPIVDKTYLQGMVEDLVAAGATMD